MCSDVSLYVVVKRRALEVGVLRSAAAGAAWGGCCSVVDGHSPDAGLGQGRPAPLDRLALRRVCARAFHIVIEGATRTSASRPAKTWGTGRGAAVRQEGRRCGEREVGWMGDGGEEGEEGCKTQVATENSPNEIRHRPLGLG